MLFDFTKKSAADLMEKKFGVKFDTNIDLIEPEVVEISVSSKIEMESNGYYLYRNNEDEYLMFAYKKSSYIEKNGFPKYHTHKCTAREAYEGYVFSSKMPVDVKCTQTGKEYNKDNKQYLNLCRDCKKITYSKFWSSLGTKKWFDNVLAYVERQNNILPKRPDGYVRMWKQISRALREKNKFKCNRCKIQLLDLKLQKYLHVHHKDENKLNNVSSNLECLCLICHSLEHSHTLSDFNWIEKIIQFHLEAKEEILNKNKKKYENWKIITDEYFRKYTE